MAISFIEMNQRILEAFGLSHLPVISLTLNLQASSIPTVEVVFELGWLDDADQHVVTELKRYELTEIDD